MRARVGDHLVVSGPQVGGRECEVVEARRYKGEPPYLVRWMDTGQEELFLPGPGASILKHEPRRRWRVVPITWPDPF
jgi:Domain of unknown function (DUF1918)